MTRLQAPGTTTISVKPQVAKEARDASAEPCFGQPYTLQPEQSLLQLAERLLGSGASALSVAQEASRIARHNGIVDPAQVQSGQFINIPPAPSQADAPLPLTSPVRTATAESARFATAKAFSNQAAQQLMAQISRKVAGESQPSTPDASPRVDPPWTTPAILDPATNPPWTTPAILDPPTTPPWTTPALITPTQTTPPAGQPLGPDDPLPCDLQTGKYDYPRVMQTWSQLDPLSGPTGTNTDPERCSCNAAVGAMLARGREPMGAHLDKMTEAAMRRYETAVKKGDMQTAGLWADLALACQDAKFKASMGTLSTNDLSRLSDRMYTAYQTTSPNNVGGLTGNVQDEMLRDCGLSSGVPTHPVQLPSRELAAKAAFATLAPGQTASLECSLNTPTKQDHTLMIGKKADGTVFCYDSGLVPPKNNYLEGEAALKLLEQRAVDCQNGTYGYRFHHHGGARVE